MIRVIRNTLINWVIVTCLILFESTWIYTRHGLAGTQKGPFTNVRLTLASAAVIWLLAVFLPLLLSKTKITKTRLPARIGFFVTGFGYLNILRERVRYGDIGYYTEAAFRILKDQSLPDTYLYPPLWATLLSFPTPFVEDRILLIAWTVTLLSLFLFYFLLIRILEHYQFKAQFAALIATLFILLIKKLASPSEWMLFAAAYLIFLIPTFDYFPWSYERLAGMLIMLGLAWATLNRKDSHYFTAANPWPESLFISERQTST